VQGLKQQLRTARKDHGNKVGASGNMARVGWGQQRLVREMRLALAHLAGDRMGGVVHQWQLERPQPVPPL
jgi:hypothetical protein